jgi:SAM-dependent methyltransferase
VTTRRDFAGGNQAYLRHVQYADASKLAARSRLHLEASTAEVPWYAWLAGQVEWPARALVVEAGCGRVWFWTDAAAPAAGARVVLTDQSLGMAAGARANAGERRSSVAVGVADVQALPFADGITDVVVANHMLYHAPSPEHGVAELARVLRRQGTALISTNGAAHMRELTAMVRAVFPDHDDTMSFVVSTFGRETGEPMLRRHFADVEWRPYPDHLVCHDAEVVLGYLTSFPPAEEASAAELGELRSRVDAAFVAAGGVLRVTRTPAPSSPGRRAGSAVTAAPNCVLGLVPRTTRSRFVSPISRSTADR